MTYTQEIVHAIVEKQRQFFRTGVTLDVNWRIEQLKKLRQAVIDHRDMLEKALWEDLRKSPTEAYLCDLGPVIVEVNEILHGLKRWARPERHFSGLMCFPSVLTTVYKMPYGVSLIISPFNFPILLTLGVLAASISGGNTAVLKTSSKSAASTRALKEL
ncbi:MAG: aldehyde dehydrogenase family protein, partial [Clostridia bacterium]|nr:aldehyde dehydrogenase family protein [Clostridia bacterium]